MEALFSAAAVVQSFAVGARVYVLTSNEVIACDPVSWEILARHTLFTVNGKSRALFLDEDCLVCKDYIRLFFLDQDTLCPIREYRLGQDNRSDICALAADEDYLFCSIRGGEIARISKANSEAEPEFFRVSETGIWAMVCHAGKLYAGNVDGQLLIIPTDTLQPEKPFQAHKSNLKSLLIHENLLFTAG